MTNSMLVFGIWALLAVALILSMATRELNTGRARALRLEDSPLESQAVTWPAAFGLTLAVLLCLVI